MSSTRPAKRMVLSHVPPVTGATVRKFGLVMIAGFGLIGVMLHCLAHPSAARAAWGVGGAVGLLSLALPGPMRPLYRAWMAVAGVLGRINGAILLTLFYVLMLCPIALVMRLLGRDELRLRRKPVETYWEPKSLPEDPRAYFNQY